MDASIIDGFRKNVVQKPEVFFTPSEEVANEIKMFAKHAYDRTSKYPSKSGGADPLEELYIDGFDADQVWEQLRLLNGPLVTELTQRIRTFCKNPDNILLFPSAQEKKKEEEIQDTIEVEKEVVSDIGSDKDGDDEKSDDGTLDKSTTATIKVQSTKTNKVRDVAEDGFFDWDEMDKAAEEEEDDVALDDNENDEDEEEEDSEMEEDSDAETAENLKYADFFHNENDTQDEKDGGEEEEEELNDVKKHGKENEMEYVGIEREQLEKESLNDDEDVAERGVLSTHQRQRQRLQKEIQVLEQEAIGEKPWLLKGEVRAAVRTENSLLEAVLDYDRPVKAAPVITEEVSIALEDMIKKRILEDDYDDVVRKFAGNENELKQKLVDISMEKSNEGLGEIYEKEYMKTAMGFEADDESKQDQDAIDVMFKSLCWKLDALSNYHFTPKPAVKELQVKPAVPAIAMEEVIPMGVSDANLKAPEEVYEKKRKRGEAVLQSKEEMTQKERKALRNAKKHTRRKEKRQRECDERLVAKLNPGLGNKYEKKKMLESIASAKNITTGKQIEGSSKQFSNSKEFFTRLQDEVQNKVRHASTRK